MRYRIEFTSTALRDLRALPRNVQRRIDARILALADNPRPPGVKKLADTECLYRLRVGDYRVVYQILDDRLIIVVVRLGHRREVYRNL